MNVDEIFPIMAKNSCLVMVMATDKLKMPDVPATLFYHKVC